jgi:hypothetical protein
MNVGRHHCTQGRKHHAVALEGPPTEETLRNDAHAKMPFAFACASMARMEMAFVDDLELHWAKRVFEQGANSVYARGIPHGRLITRAFSRSRHRVRQRLSSFAASL